MFHCKNCGEEISEFQFNNFNSICPECIRISQMANIQNTNIQFKPNKLNIDDLLNEKEVVYVLKLQNEKWWIGKTKDIKKRMREYKKGRSNQWIKIYPLISLEEIDEQSKLSEKMLEYMKKYGWENVRGTCYYENISPDYIPMIIYNYIENEKKKQKIELDSDKIIREGSLYSGINENKREINQINYDKSHIYVLKLERNKWYIGKTNNLEAEIEKHKSGEGLSWTKLYKVISLEESIENGDYRDKTIEYIKKYGWWNVRGYSFKSNNETWPLEEFKEQFEGFEEYQKENPIIYILKLEHDKWFVGKTYNLKRSIDFHNKGSPPWVDIHKPIEIYKTFDDGNIRDITLDLMKEYGWENVRGSGWKKWNLKNPPLALRSE
ncbi:MAG: hypothetical protein JXA99_08425 [Candidatus Lokiarchaeota archaeon]|nr:hypothetical protein [Candidatus Lokiarchaeota archaeon]